ncbi:F-box only protein 28 [Anabrus simplex]|uniref:F-box only protein 28 n=1 Tax=Anabrus simplex TaxID=316456 RepID=UPI0034DD2237
MVSTRQSSNVGGGSENSASVPDTGTTKLLRHSNNSPPAELSSGSSVQDTDSLKSINLVDLPPEILEKIFSYLTYKNVAHARPVCRKVDSVCCSILNSTFQRLQNQMLHRFQSIKAKMPRRESARRTHPLACESDIIETLHMRLTLLHMTFGKHIERRHCCFFAGEILDEVYRILNYIKVTPIPLARPYKVTDELFDLSTMAMEYFKEHIEPTLPEIAYFGTEFLNFTGTFTSASSSKSYLCLDSPPHSSSNKSFELPSQTSTSGIDEHVAETPPQSNMVLRKRIRKIKQGMKRYNSQLTLMRRDLRSCKSKIAEQQKQILEYASRLDENDKKNEETSRKFSTLLQELNKCKTELQYWRSKSPANPPVCVSCGKTMAPVPTEELQALANQGVMPEGLGLDLGAETCGAIVDFVPIAGTSNNEIDDNYWDVFQVEEATFSTAKKDVSVATATLVSGKKDKEEDESLQQLPSTKISGIKRKASDEIGNAKDVLSGSGSHVLELKKSKRITKGRSKRAKV